jgi:hypothetical protein
LLALLFPIFFPGDNLDNEAKSTYVVEHDIVRALVSIVDVVGLYLILNGKRLITVMGDIEVKIISVGLGWAFSELLTSHFLDIIF